MGNDRREAIEEMLNKNGSVRLDALTDIFPDVSTMTLRRDLIYFEDQGIAIRVKGGAILASKANQPGEESAYGIREMAHKEAKIAVAKKALQFLETGRSIYLDAGSTLMTFAEMVDDDYYSFITSGINVASKLLEKEHPNVVVLGGYANRNTLSLSGPLSTRILDAVNIDLAFISTSGYTIDNDFTVSNIYEADLKRQIIGKAKQVIVLMDSSKIGKSLPYTFCKTEDVDLLITETSLSDDVVQYMKKKNTQYL